MKKLDYEAMVQTALRSVVRDSISLVAKHSLQGNHHFYITFTTTHPNVEMPDYLREQYPDEITVVLQHEFWDLEANDYSFSVTLCFNDIHERLVIPYSAIVSFVDPSVKFGLQFAPQFDPPPPTLKTKKGKKDKDNEIKSESNVVTLDFSRRK